MHGLILVSLVAVSNPLNGTICRVLEEHNIICTLPDTRKFYCFAIKDLCIQVKTIKSDTI